MTSRLGNTVLGLIILCGAITAVASQQTEGEPSNCQDAESHFSPAGRSGDSRKKRCGTNQGEHARNRQDEGGSTFGQGRTGRRGLLPHVQVREEIAGLWAWAQLKQESQCSPWHYFCVFSSVGDLQLSAFPFWSKQPASKVICSFLWLFQSW